MTTAIEAYRFTATDTEIRTVMRNGTPWFVAADVCAALDLTNPSQTVSYLDDDERDTLITSEGRSLNIVSEAGLYSLILRSRKPEAKAFKRWITHDVLPAIRQTGKYEAAPALPMSYADALRELASTVEQRDAAAAALAIAAPAADAWNHLASGDGDYAIADAAKILSRDPAIKLGRDRLFALLEGWGWIYRQAIDGRYRVYQAQVETGRLSELPSSHYHPKTGDLVLDPPQVRVKAKGLEEIRNRLIKEQQ